MEIVTTCHGINFPLFAGVCEEELAAVLVCLAAPKRKFPKEAFLLRARFAAERERRRGNARFDRCAACLLAYSATGGARVRILTLDCT